MKCLLYVEGMAEPAVSTEHLLHITYHLLQYLTKFLQQSSEGKCRIAFRSEETEDKRREHTVLGNMHWPSFQPRLLSCIKHLTHVAKSP